MIDQELYDTLEHLYLTGRRKTRPERKPAPFRMPPRGRR